MSGQSDRLADVLAEHQQASGWCGYLWRNHACTCGWWSTHDQESDHRTHVATALLSVVEQMSNERAAEAWERGVGEERLHQQRVTSYTHWSGISAGPPQPLVNPYRATAAADGREDGGRG